MVDIVWSSMSRVSDCFIAIEPFFRFHIIVQNDDIFTSYRRVTHFKGHVFISAGQIGIEVKEVFVVLMIHFFPHIFSGADVFILKEIPGYDAKDGKDAQTQEIFLPFSL